MKLHTCYCAFASYAHCVTACKNNYYYHCISIIDMHSRHIKNNTDTSQKQPAKIFVPMQVNSALAVLQINLTTIEACIGVIGIQDICHFTSRDIGYYPFYFQ